MSGNIRQDSWSTIYTTNRLWYPLRYMVWKLGTNYRSWKLTFQEKSVMRIASWMLLRLEECIEVPEATVSRDSWMLSVKDTKLNAGSGHECSSINKTQVCKSKSHKKRTEVKHRIQYLLSTKLFVGISSNLINVVQSQKEMTIQTLYFW